MVNARRRRWVGRLIPLAVAFSACAQSGAAVHLDATPAPPNDARPSRFHVFNAIGARGTPDLAPYGLEKINLVYASAIWMGADMTVPPADSNVLKVAGDATALDVLTCLDVEQWRVDQRNTPSATVDTGVQYYEVLAQSFAVGAPGIPFGYYGFPPIRQVNVAAPGTPAFVAWQQANDRIRPIVGAVNVAFPSLYTFTSDPGVWVAYAKANIAEARRVAPTLPVYAFIWPRYHEGTPMALQPVDGAYWRTQLETLKGVADGVVIWDSSKLAWDEGAAWWQETKSFLAELSR